MEVEGEGEEMKGDQDERELIHTLYYYTTTIKAMELVWQKKCYEFCWFLAGIGLNFAGMLTIKQQTFKIAMQLLAFLQSQ